jgi:phosphatidylinositol alpha-1,6-mannosyltransferase
MRILRHGRSTGAPDLLALFPSFDSAVFGGVQASGREAWRGITSRAEWTAEAFFYEPGAAKLPALLRALAHRGPVGTVLIWHSGLLKLTPFIASGKPKRVLFLHGVEVWRKHDHLTSMLMRNTDLFLSNSDHTWRRFLSFHPECGGNAHQTVHLGIGEPLNQAAPVPDGPPAALMIGRMQRDENYKGHREVLEVWQRVLQAMPAAELWIVGGGDLRPELEAMVQAQSLGDRVRFFGAVPDEVKEDLLRKCRALVLPSAGEGFGLVYLEAMRMGRPCLVSTLDAGAEVVNPPEAGLAVDLHNPSELTASIIRLLTAGSEWNQMAVGAKQRYDAQFTGHHFQERLVNALR